MFDKQPPIVFITAAAIFLAVYVAGAEKSFGESNSARLDGSWMGTVTATNPPLGSFTDLITFNPHGGVIESRRLYVPESPFGSLLETPGHGEWRRVGKREFQVHFVFLLQGAPDNQTSPGASLGTDNISLRLQLNEDGTELTGTFESDIKDPNGNVVFTATGTYSATPIHVVSGN